jgi:hypothetical protein
MTGEFGCDCSSPHKLEADAEDAAHQNHDYGQGIPVGSTLSAFHSTHSAMATAERSADPEYTATLPDECSMSTLPLFPTVVCVSECAQAFGSRCSVSGATGTLVGGAWATARAGYSSSNRPTENADSTDHRTLPSARVQRRKDNRLVGARVPNRPASP